MIKLDLEMPKNTFECPFLEEDSDNNLWCYFEPQVEKRCTGLFKDNCPIIKDDTERNILAEHFLGKN